MWALTRALRARGHDVTLFAAPGSDPGLGAELLPVKKIVLSEAARYDVSMPAELAMAEHHAYLSLMLTLGHSTRFDLVHNHSLHHLPIALAALLSCPLVSTLHTPPTPWLESAIAASGARNVSFVAVSEHAARAWRNVAGPMPVIRNGIDLQSWPAGPGGSGTAIFADQRLAHAGWPGHTDGTRFMIVAYLYRPDVEVPGFLG